MSGSKTFWWFVGGTFALAFVFGVVSARREAKAKQAGLQAKMPKSGTIDASNWRSGMDASWTPGLDPRGHRSPIRSTMQPSDAPPSAAAQTVSAAKPIDPGTYIPPSSIIDAEWKPGISTRRA